MLVAFRQKRSPNFRGKAQQQKYYKPIQKPRNPIDPNTGVIMRCSSCDAKTHLIKDCYDTYEKVRARIKVQTEKGQQLVVESQNLDGDEQHIFLSQDRIEEVLLQVQTSELKTLGGHTSGFMLLDSGCSGSVAGDGWMDDNIEGLDPEEQNNVVVKQYPTKNVRFVGGDIYPSSTEYCIPA